MNDGLYLSNANWKHVKSGVTYRIVGFSSREEDETILIHYKKWDGISLTEVIWTRPATEFFDGRFVRLFPNRRED